MTPYYADDWLTVYLGDCRAVMAQMDAGSAHCVVTSPPYWGLRDYGTAGQLGLEPTPEAYVASMVDVFREVRRVLRDDGTVWLNLGDSYASSGGPVSTAPTNTRNAGAGGITRVTTVRSSRPAGGLQGGTRTVDVSLGAGGAPGLKPKDLVGIPWRVAFALQADGWYLRSDIIWSKPNPMPESVTDRPTKAHEYLFLLSKSARYYYDADAVREANVSEAQATHNARYAKHYDLAVVEAGQNNSASIHSRGTADGRNLRSVWTIATQPYPGAHFATFPRKLVEPCIKAGCPEGGTVLDPFAGSGTTAMVAQSYGRKTVLIDLNADYLEQVMDRNRVVTLGLGA